MIVHVFRIRLIHTSLQYMQDAPELHTKLGYSL